VLLAPVVTAGIVLDRYVSSPLLPYLLVAGASLIAWTATRLSPHRGLPLIYISITGLALGAAYHHWYRNIYLSNDIGNFAATGARPIHLRGWIEEQPMPPIEIPRNDPLRSFARSQSGHAVVGVTEFEENEGWISASGRAQLTCTEPVESLYIGHYVDVVGRLVAPETPANPGELDSASHLLDRRIRARVLLKSSAGLTRLDGDRPNSIRGWLAVLRGWGVRTFRQILPEQSGVASALVLGEYSAMSSEEWDRYIETGVIHVVVISGLHLAILAWVFWWILRPLPIRRRQGACFVALFILAYALITGGRPPTMRAAIMVCSCCGAFLLRRPPISPNLLAFCWLTVIAINPTSVFDSGCQLSFLSVAILYWGVRHTLVLPSFLYAAIRYWGTGRALVHQHDPLDRLVEETRPAWQRVLRRLARRIGEAYAVTFMVWFAITPLVVSRYHLISFVGLLIGPPMMVMGSIALFAGFAVLLAAAVCPPVGPPIALVFRCSLAGCESIVSLAERLPGSHVYVGIIPSWWLWGFYGGLFVVLTTPWLLQRWRWALIVGLAWVCVALLVLTVRFPPDEMRCTFLAVGHGGCAVFETSDGRTLLYDAGSLSGPEVTRRQIAPFLWHRGIRRIDEVFLSHADLDHFNGLPDLLERFAVGQVTCTPTFEQKQTPGVPYTLEALERYKVPRRIVRAGDRLMAGDMQIDVLHPPPVGPDGNENARSMVLLIRHAGHTLLLTGDLEGPGLDQLLAAPRMPVDILMAPHHGSAVSNTPRLAVWAQPKVVVSCEGLPRGQSRPPEPYSGTGAVFLGTWPHGAITIHSHKSGLVAETFQTGQRLVVRRGSRGTVSRQGQMKAGFRAGKPA
jgi:competence protein ComEC